LLPVIGGAISYKLKSESRPHLKVFLRLFECPYLYIVMTRQ